jgi:phage gpG-like protein
MAQFFELRFTVEGVPELSRMLAITNQRLSDFKLPLQKSAGFILADVERNFISEGGLVGGWQPLAPSTVKGRIREGYGGEHPILERTGSLRRSFFSTVTNTKAMVTSGSPYFAFHQSRLPRKRLPRRAMLVLTEYTRQNIVQEFNQYIRGKNI